MPSSSLHSTMLKYWDNQIVIYTVHIILTQSTTLLHLAYYLNKKCKNTEAELFCDGCGWHTADRNTIRTKQMRFNYTTVQKSSSKKLLQGRV